MAKKGKSGKKKKSSDKSKEPVQKFQAVVTLPPITQPRCATLQTTIITHDTTTFNRLIAHYDYEKDLTTIDANGSSLIHIAVKKKDESMLNSLLSFKKININILEYPNLGGYSALHHACMNNFVKGVELLVDGGANADIKCNNINGETPLMLACKLGHTECARLLLNGGASPNTVDNFGNNSSFWAYKYQQTKLIQELQLPAVHSADADEFIKLLLQRNPRFQLPTLKAAKKGKKGDKAKKK